MKMEERHFGPIRFIPGENRGKYPFCHSVYVEGAGVLIDPGAGRERLCELSENCAVNQVWLSHWHEDHFKYLGMFDDLPICCSEEIAPMLADIEVFIDAYGIVDESRAYWRNYFIQKFDLRPRKAARLLKGGEVISLGNVTVDVVATPGHTCGHLAFFFREPKVLFMGDYDLSKFGPWYADVHSSIEETVGSLKRLKEIPARVWLTSHEAGVFDEEPWDEWLRYLDAIYERERKLIRLLEEPRSFEEIVGAWIVYGKPYEPEAGYKFMEGMYMKKHLKRLMAQGIVGIREGRYRKL